MVDISAKVIVIVLFSLSLKQRQNIAAKLYSGKIVFSRLKQSFQGTKYEFFAPQDTQSIVISVFYKLPKREQ